MLETPIDPQGNRQLEARLERRGLPDRFCNFDRFMTMMTKLDLDGVVSSFSPNVFYLTGFLGTQAAHDVGSPGVAVIPRHDPDRAVLISPEPLLSSLVSLKTWVRDVRGFSVTSDLGTPFDPGIVERFIAAPLRGTEIGRNMAKGFAPTQPAAIQAALNDLGLAQKRIGFDNAMTANIFSRHVAEAVNVYGAMIWVRSVKTHAELEIMRTATLVNQTAILRTVEAWSDGMTHRELNRLYGSIVYDLGGVPESPSANVIFNADSDDPMAAEPVPLPWQTGLETDYVIRRGANIMFDCHGWWNKYCWDGGKTWIVDDEPVGEGRRIALASQEATDRMLEAMRPGRRISELQALGRDVFRKSGLPADAPVIFFHGLGLEHNDLETPPGAERELQDRFDWVLEEGMVLAPHIAYPGGVRERYYIEPVGVVTSGGGESLFDWDNGPLLSTR